MANKIDYLPDKTRDPALPAASPCGSEQLPIQCTFGHVFDDHLYESDVAMRYQ